jgi:hypothetical protein
MSGEAALHRHPCVDGGASGTVGLDYVAIKPDNN